MRVETKTALLACTELARAGKRTMAKDLARAIKAPPAMLAKTLQRLARTGVLKSRKGPAGGFELHGCPTIARVMKACGEDPYDLPYIGVAATMAAVRCRVTTTMLDLAHEERGQAEAG